jgi:hypothetical protein
VALSRAPHPDQPGVRWLVVDLAQPGTVADVVTSVRPEVVIHLAGAVRGDRSLAAVAPTLRANLVASVELLEAATRLGCRRIVLSGSLLEEPASGGPQAVPPSPYGASRWAASAYGRMFHALFDAPVVILRPSFAYGPGQEQTKLNSSRHPRPAGWRKPAAELRGAPARLRLCRGCGTSLRRGGSCARGRRPHDRHRHRSAHLGARDRSADRRLHRADRGKAGVRHACRAAPGARGQGRHRGDGPGARLAGNQPIGGGPARHRRSVPRPPPTPQGGVAPGAPENSEPEGRKNGSTRVRA